MQTIQTQYMPSVSKIEGINKLRYIGKVKDFLYSLKQGNLCKGCFDGCESCINPYYCTECEGEGTLTESNISADREDFDVRDVVCHECDGLGLNNAYQNNLK